MTRLGEDQFLVVTSVGSHFRDLVYLKEQIDPAQFCTVTDVTAGMPMLGLMGPRSRELLQALSGEAGPLAGALLTTRAVYFAEQDGYIDCPFYDRYKLAAGHELAGPAIVIELDSTTVIHPGYHAEVDRFGNLMVTLVS